MNPAPSTRSKKSPAQAWRKRVASAGKRAGARRTPESRQQRALDRGELVLQNRSLRESAFELELSRERYANLYDSAPVSFVTLTFTGLIYESNLSAARMLGHTRSFLAGSPFIIFVAERDRRKFLSHLSRCHKNRKHTEPLSVELEIIPKNSREPMYIELISTPAKGAHDRQPVYRSIFFDITGRKRREDELKRARDEAERANRAKDDFLATLSHELRNPLNPVMLVADDAVRDPELPPRIRANFDLIRRNIEVEARLIDDLLDLSRITRGKLELNKKPVRVHDLLLETISTMLPDIEQKQLVLKERLLAQRDTVLGDNVRLRQIFWNVLRNAVKFTPPGGLITVEVGVSDKKELFVAVSDSGIGMAPHEISHVFEAFTQGDHAANKGAHSFGGLGIGLAIARRLVELHSGSIEASSPGRNLGSTFTIRLPLAVGCTASQPAKPALPTASQAVAPGSPGVRILVVEDHDATRNALAVLLLRRNHKVQTAASIKEAKAAVQENQFDLLISDIGLPDGSGNDLMRDLGEKHHLRGIALTGYGMEEDVKRSYAAGFVTHLTKPVKIESLEQALATASAARAPGT